ncbi:uncharacterized protein LOC129591503 [Paramacrobiotus metropolitanus]|uniref:uncharacterized protein LOC129591503 n=1 Tax=Paramacrobiotus metropolitanus TaxID=2943436 RepID=UPI0024464FEE|nr:uncharacterized protein LOC129591503 [Paramacrobiotus metropolitanus]
MKISAPAQGTSTFSDVPDEVISHIFSFLDVIDISNSTVVCKQWQRVSNAVELQKKVIIDLLKWKTHQPLPVPVEMDDYFDFCDIKEVGHRALLKKFVTARTRNIIIRWPVGSSSSPEPVMIEDHPDLEYGESFHYCHYEAVAIQRQLVDIFGSFPGAAATGGIFPSMRTL